MMMTMITTAAMTVMVVMGMRLKLMMTMIVLAV